MPQFTGNKFGFFGSGVQFGTEGASLVSPTFTATGGGMAPDSTTANGYTYHVFTSDSTWVVSDAGGGEGYVEILTVGGGGGGGARGGAGGAGGCLYKTVPIPSTMTCPVTIGEGGGGHANSNPGSGAGGQDGGTTSIVFPTQSPFTQPVGGGGGGGGFANSGEAAPNGSSGGGGRDAGGGAGPDPGNPATGHGGGGSNDNNNAGGGGGGGAMGRGSYGPGAAPTNEIGGSGGFGVFYPGMAGPLISPPGTANPGVPATMKSGVGDGGSFAAGGSGGSNSPAPNALNNLSWWYPQGGVGGRGGINSPPSDHAATPGVEFTGSGGGGGGDHNGNNQGGNGADGVVIVRYKKAPASGTGGANTTTGPATYTGGPGGFLKATGGVTEFNAPTSTIIHYFVQPGTFSIIDSSPITGCKVLLVGAGGCGGARHGGGGGAGGVVYSSSFTLPNSPADYAITVGDGGRSSQGDSRPVEGNGAKSEFTHPGTDTITAHGGGAGGAFPGNQTGLGGSGYGSGGGGGGDPGASGGTADPTFTLAGNPVPKSYGTVIQYGGAGGEGSSGSPDWRDGGGGGGATEAGDGESGNRGGNGVPITIGSSSWWFGGGGGGSRLNWGPSTGTAGDGGKGGGGAGGLAGPSGAAGPEAYTPGGDSHWLSPSFPNTSNGNGGGSDSGPGCGAAGVFGTGGGGGGQGQGLAYNAQTPLGGQGGMGAPGIVIFEYPVGS